MERTSYNAWDHVARTGENSLELTHSQTIYRENMNSNNFIHRNRKIQPPESTAKSLIFELNSIGTVFKQESISLIE